uniref:Uncharacterized protein n=1 Tax=Calcidiscus leptoporus TaxID=127549 RepID=A0A7S0NN68_9EUKA|mmetsp:Transcript_10678/g.24791  ORF Transcript_10678/g.24791 Transcript_10678/m.24791 type:complete len:270 (+) Transcript_10678:91-900(+)
MAGSEAAGSEAAATHTANERTGVTQCYSFLLGSHLRLGMASPVQKLPQEILRHICGLVLKGVGWHFHSCVAIGIVDLWLLDSAPKNRPPRAILQHQRPGEPTATRFLGLLRLEEVPTVGGALCKWGYDLDNGGCPLLFYWTHKATGIEPDRPLAASKQQLGATKVKGDLAFILPDPKPAVSKAHNRRRSGFRSHGFIDIRVIGISHEGVRLARIQHEGTRCCHPSLSSELLLPLAADSSRSATTLAERAQRLFNGMPGATEWDWEQRAD